MAYTSKDTSIVPEDVNAVAGSEHFQSSSDAPPVTQDVAIVPAHSPLWESSIPDEDAREPMHLNKDNLGREDSIASAPTIEKRKTILIEDSDSNNHSQIASMDVPTGAGDTPADMHIAVKASCIDYL